MDDDDLLSRANSLIKADAGALRGERRESPRQVRRRRSFLASADPADTEDGGTRFPRRSSEEDDLPLLTDVVAAEDAEAAETAEEIAARLRPALAAEVAQIVGRSLEASLLTLVEAALVDASDRLRRDLEASLTTALRDFVAQRGQLQLPLDEPANDQVGEAGQE